MNPFILKNKERMVVFLDHLSSVREKPYPDEDRVKGDPARWAIPCFFAQFDCSFFKFLFPQGPCYNSPHLRGSSRRTERHQQREHGADQDPCHRDRDALEAQAEVHRDVSKQQLAVWGAPRLGRGAPCHRRLEPVHRHPRLGPGGGQCCARCCQGG